MNTFIEKTVPPLILREMYPKVLYFMDWSFFITGCDMLKLFWSIVFY